MPRKTKGRGTDNVLADHEFPDAEELTAKTIFNDILLSRSLTQAEAAELLGMPQPKVSAIRNYKLRGISLERLMQACRSGAGKRELHRQFARWVRSTKPCFVLYRWLAATTRVRSASSTAGSPIFSHPY